MVSSREAISGRLLDTRNIQYRDLNRVDSNPSYIGFKNHIFVVTFHGGQFFK
jgi:hypothetical protein